MNRSGKTEHSAEGGGIDRRRLLMAFAGTVALSGCGWKPLYERPGASVNSGGASTALAGISIDPVEPSVNPNPLRNSLDSLYDSRSAQLLQNYLKEGLNPYGAPNPPLYRLVTQLKQMTRSAATLGDGSTTREDLVMIADIQLHDLNMAKKPKSANGTKSYRQPTTTAPAERVDPEVAKAQAKQLDLENGILLRDQAKIVTSYDILREPYADLSSRRDAQQRAVQQLAEAMQTRLAAFLVK